MHFKHPEILYFLFLLVIPIIVHLFQLRRFKKEYFTNVKFLRDLSIQTRKSSKLKKYLLLATRLLLLACAIIAFAQPFFEAADHKAATNELYVVLDNSFSMQAKGQQGELLKRSVQELLESMPENQRFSLLTGNADFWNTDIRSLRNELQQLKGVNTPFRLDAQLAKIKAHRSPYDRDIVVVTDAVGMTPDQLKGLPPSSSTYFIVPKAQQLANVSADSVYIKQTLDRFYEIGIDLSAYHEVTGDVPVALFDHDKLVAKTLVKFDTPKKSIAFTIPKAGFDGYVSVTDNALAYDNNLYFNLSAPRKINVLAVGAPDRNQFLEKLYTPDEFQLLTYTPETLDYNLLEKQDAVVLNELRSIPQALQTTLRAFTEKGGNLIVIPSGAASAAELGNFLSGFGSIRVGAKSEAPKKITKIHFDHPLYRGVFEKTTENFQYPSANASFPFSNAAPVLSFEDQSPFLVALPQPVSTVYVFASPIAPGQSNFEQSPLIVPTFYNMAQPARKTGVIAETIGRTQPFWLDAVIGKDEILSLKGPGGNDFIPEQQVLNQKVKLAFGEFPETAGNYDVMRKAESIGQVSFNYARTESDLTSNLDVLSGYKTAETLETVFTRLATDRTDNQLWKWFAIFALLLLVTEIFIQKFVK